MTDQTVTQNEEKPTEIKTSLLTEKVDKVDKNIDTVKALVDSLQDQIKVALPKQIDPDRMIRVFVTELKRNPKLLECNQLSLMAALMRSSQLGLEPGPLGQCHLVPYGKEVEFQISYKGMIELVRRSGNLKTIDGECVFEKDEFSYQKGLHPDLKHVPCLDEDRGALKAVYCVVNFNDGGTYFNVLGKAAVMKSKKASKSSGSPHSPWNTWEDEMWLKTAIKKAFKFLPISIEHLGSIETDGAISKKVNENMKDVNEDDVINVDFESKV